jgi:hypothetical protein
MRQQKIIRSADRLTNLIAVQNRKMAASAQAFVRGSTTRFYEWLEASDRRPLPEGPRGRLRLAVLVAIGEGKAERHYLMGVKARSDRRRLISWTPKCRSMPPKGWWSALGTRLHSSGST